ncbi:MAG: DUF211 domain-containing protein [Gammaproteobacteria bacterium]|nr:DUF211 domain-containing protein [Gammaproteobacteria bacterium]NIR88938.1 DUF211 domain-containing protein [Gammaproteobacteria bacterium]NIU05227.1 DUF211 domain-containing protein [Gammaproteobacteria bacterium]NIV52842.1 hypothetical protein [Gammaproteobacteria bacterium]NIW85138.1 hypothetical protein [Gammaproteobacteria bacterium]
MDAVVKRVVLDVLKPHEPNALDFSRTLAEQGRGYRIKLTIEEMDEKTQSTVIEIEGENIDFDTIIAAIQRMGGSVHSIDEVVVEG